MMRRSLLSGLLLALMAAPAPARAQTVPGPLPPGQATPPPAQAPVPAPAVTPVTTGERQLVVPFENTARAGRVLWLSEGSAILLSDDLTALGAPALPRDERLEAFERLHVPSVSTLSYATVIRLGQLVGAAQVVTGAFEVTAETITVRARAIRLDTGRLLPEVVESGPLNELFLVYARVARRLAPAESVSVEQMEQGHPPLTAFEAFVKGLLAENPETQVTFLAEALRLAPAFQRARLALWAVRTDQGEHARALEVTRQVPATHPLSRRARFLSTSSMLALGQLAGASDLLQALNRESTDPALLNNLGVIQLRRPVGTPPVKASGYFLEATRLDPNDADLYFNLGYAWLLERDLPAALGALREAVRRDAADADAHSLLALALQASGPGTTVEAGRERELARRLSSRYAQDARGGAAGTPSAPPPIPRGLERIKRSLDAGTGWRVNDVIVAAGQRDQQELSLFHLESGRRLYLAERDLEAITELRRAVYLAPYQSEAHLLLGRAYLRSGQLTEAVSALKVSLWSAETTAAHLVLAEAYLQARDTAAARDEIRAVQQRDPANVEARRLLERLGPVPTP